MTAADSGRLPDHLVVGHVAKPHGTRGEVVVESLTDHPGDVFVPGVVLRPADPTGSRPAPDEAPLRIEEAHPFQSRWRVAFGGVRDRDAADRLRGRYLLIERERLPALEEGEVFLHQLPGLEVWTVGGERVGEVREVYDLRPAELLEVDTGHGTVLIPFLGPVVRSVDVQGRRIVIDPPEGLLE